MEINPNNRNCFGLIKLFFTEEIYIPVNLGNPDTVTMNQLASEILNYTNSKSKIVFKPLPVDDPKKRKPDISRAKKLLDWEPKISRKEGLQKTIEYYRKSMPR